MNKKDKKRVQDEYKQLFAYGYFIDKDGVKSTQKFVTKRKSKSSNLSKKLKIEPVTIKLPRRANLFYYDEQKESFLKNNPGIK